MIKMVDVDKVPERAPPLSELVDEFLASGKTQVKLDLTGEDRARQVIYSGIYNSIKNRDLNVKVSMVDGEIYLQRTNDFKQPIQE